MVTQLSQRLVTLALTAGLVVACTRGGAGDRGVQTSLTGATVETSRAPLPPPSRTTDAAGYVDNGGRRSSELARGGELSGARPTEQGGQTPTGTPGVGTPLPLDPLAAKGRESATPERAVPPPAAPRPAAAGDADTEWGTRLARARCDRATFCNGIGPGRMYGSQDACVAAERVRALDEIAQLPCDATFIAQNACLSELRVTACGAPEDLERGACSAAALCGG